MRKKIYRELLALIISLLPLSLKAGEQYCYTNGAVSFTVKETRSEYQVYCFRESGELSSRNKNIADRKLRITAIDLIGTYIIYRTDENTKHLGPEYFSAYVEGLNLHYTAILEGLRMSEKTVDGNPCICFSCDKDKYSLTSATFNKNPDISTILERYYGNGKNADTARLLYYYQGFTARQYCSLERDFLTGTAVIPQTARALQAIPDRFELSVYSPENEILIDVWRQTGFTQELSNPYKTFYLEELVTGAPLKDKKKWYQIWQASLSADNNTYESIIRFVAKNTHVEDLGSDVVLSDVIEAFPGAISPFGMLQPINDDSYNEAVRAYSNSDFEEAAAVLREIVDNEGISPKVLNLLGASYRFLGRCDMALTYLLLCFKINPSTEFLAGNIYLCLKELKYRDLQEVRDFLSNYTLDAWSRQQVGAE